MRRIAWIGCMASIVLAALAAGGSAGLAAPRTTPDQALAGALEQSAAAANVALRNLTRPTEARTRQAATQLRRARTAIATATRVAPSAVGALETPSVRIALERAAVLSAGALGDVARGRLAQARSRIRALIALATNARRDFGVPLAKDFGSFAVNRDFSAVPGFTDYSGLTASTETEVTHIIVGAADRDTANAGERRSARPPAGAGLPITDMSVYIIRDEIGRFTSNWCRLSDGLITCALKPTLLPGYTYTIAFGPKLERGTRVLVKFRSGDGRRSYAVFSTR